jgi:ATP-dependent helicase HrpB
VAISLFLPFDVEGVRAAFPSEAVWTEASEFDARQGRVVREQRLLLRGLVLERREQTASKREDKKAAAELWAEKFAAGELRHPGFDEKVPQYLTRLALARRLYPDMGFPELGADDWRLIYGELCHGKNSLKDIEKVPLLPHVEAYLGKPLAGFLDKALPETKKMPSGRSGRFLYHETHPAELSARLGDFVGLKGTMALCEGRLPVIFDILAPNYRTVQKTADLSSFWANTYPTVKKELQRRYPRHPWP